MNNNNNYNNEYNNEYTQPYQTVTPQKSSNNTGLIVAVSIMGSILGIGIIIVILMLTGVISNNNTNQNNYLASSENTSVQGTTQMESQPSAGNATETVKPVPVNNTMFIGNCNTSVTLRNAPNVNGAEIRQVPLADEVYVIEYVNSEFAHVTYLGKDGYIGRKYIVEVQPQIWKYSDSDAINQVANSLRAFVNGINTGDTSYIPVYFAGSEADQEYKTNNSIRNTVESEEIISLNCHSVQRISASQVTVIRDSVIRVVYKDGTTKDVSERYKYTLDLSNGMRIIDLNKA